MRATEEDLNRVLEHAAGVVLTPTTSAQAAMLVASSSIAGGFRALAVDLATESSVDLIGSLTTRHDTVIGCVCRGVGQDLTGALAAGAAFVLDYDDDDEVAELVRGSERVWIPRIGTAERARDRRTSWEQWGWYQPGAAASFDQVAGASAPRHWLAGPGIAGNRIEEWGSAVFKRFANDKNVLTKKELTNVLKSLPRTAPKKVLPNTKYQSLEDMINAMDADGDGEISMEEMQAGQKMMQAWGERMQDQVELAQVQMMRQCDKDGDGKLTRDELVPAKKAIIKKIDKILQQGIKDLEQS